MNSLEYKYKLREAKKTYNHQKRMKNENETVTQLDIILFVSLILICLLVYSQYFWR